MRTGRLAFPRRRKGGILFEPPELNEDNAGLVSSRSELGRAFTINNRADHRDVWKLLPIRRTTQHQSAAAHVAAADEVSRKSEPVVKNTKENIDILSCSNAAEKNDLALNGQLFRQTSRVGLNRRPITRIVLVNVNRCEFTEIIKMDVRARLDQPSGRRDDEYTGNAARRPRKGSRVGNLSAKVEAAEKSEHFRNWRPLFAAQFSREFEPRSIAQNHPRAFAAGVSG
jgi:hypothetical protein